MHTTWRRLEIIIYNNDLFHCEYLSLAISTEPLPKPKMRNGFQGPVTSSSVSEN